MSKSLGNGIDPLEVIAKYGADSLRFSLLTGNSAGNDMRFYWEKVEAARNFCNKVYNAARFVLMSIDGVETAPPLDCRLDDADKWILHRLNDVTIQVSANLDAYELGLAAQKIYDFIWLEFCDWYIEMAKPRLHGAAAEEKRTAASVLSFVLSQAMKLLHPFMPFITEELYQKLPGHGETVMRASWPQGDDALCFPAECARMESLMELVRAVRNLRAERRVPPAQRIGVRLYVPEERAEAYRALTAYVQRLAGADEVEVFAGAPQADRHDVHLVCTGVDVVIPLSTLVDLDEERERLRREIERVESEYRRSAAKLDNPGFTGKAPAAVVEGERKKRDNAAEMLEKLRDRLESLAGL